jgi:hypothetical protein
MSASICLLVIDDGREEYLARCLASAAEYLPPMDACVMVDDSAHELGFAGAIQAGWDGVLGTGCEWVFHLESDFLFDGPVAIDRMLDVLQREGHLAQISLKRPPCNGAERAVGGFVELNPDAYAQHVDRGDIFTTHRVCFTTNPSLYPAATCRHGWPQEERSEGAFTHRLLEDPEVRFGIWGAKFDPPAVTHIGKERAGVGY